MLAGVSDQRSDQDLDSDLRYLRMYRDSHEGGKSSPYSAIRLTIRAGT